MKSLFYLFFIIKKRGLGFIWIYFKESIWFDLINGTSTSSRVTKDRQNISINFNQYQDGLLYVASFTSVVRITVAIAHGILGPNRLRQSQFVDLGCGKGKALLVYLRYFGSSTIKPAMGIEYDSILADQARANSKKISSASDGIEIITGSATNIRTYLHSKYAVVYLYNSFQGKTLHATLLALQGLPHVLIYVDPVERRVLLDFGYVIEAERIGRYNANTWIVARSSDLEKVLHHA